MSLSNYIIESCKFNELPSQNALEKLFEIVLIRDVFQRVLTETIYSMMLQERGSKINGFRNSNPVFTQEEMTNYANLPTKGGSTVFQDIKVDLLNEVIKDILQKHASNGYTFTTLEVKNEGENTDEVYLFRFGVSPKIDIASIIKQISCPKLSCSSVEEDVDFEVKNLLDTLDRFEITNLEQQVQSGDIVVVSYKGFVKVRGKNRPIAGGAQEEQVFKIGDGKFIKEFEEGIIGMAVGQEKVLTLAVVDNPANTANKAIAGQPIDYHIKLHKILEERKYKNLEEYLAKQNFENIEKLKEYIKNKIAQEISGKIQTVTVSGALEQLESLLCSIVIPDDIIEKELKRRVGAETFEKNSADNPDYVAIAKKQLLMGMRFSAAFAAIIENFSLTVTDNELIVEAANLIRARNIPVANTQRYMALIEFILKDNKEREAMTKKILERKVFALLAEKATENFTEEKVLTYPELNDLCKVAIDEMNKLEEASAKENEEALDEEDQDCLEETEEAPEKA